MKRALDSAARKISEQRHFDRRRRRESRVTGCGATIVSDRESAIVPARARARSRSRDLSEWRDLVYVRAWLIFAKFPDLSLWNRHARSPQENDVRTTVCARVLLRQPFTPRPRMCKRHDTTRHHDDDDDENEDGDDDEDDDDGDDNETRDISSTRITLTRRRMAKGYLLYGSLGRRVRALRLLEQRQDLPESFLLRLPRHFHRVFQQHHRNARSLPSLTSQINGSSPRLSSPRSFNLPLSEQAFRQDRGCARGRHALPRFAWGLGAARGSPPLRPSCWPVLTWARSRNSIKNRIVKLDALQLSNARRYIRSCIPRGNNATRAGLSNRDLWRELWCYFRYYRRGKKIKTIEHQMIEQATCISQIGIRIYNRLDFQKLRGKEI